MRTRSSRNRDEIHRALLWVTDERNRGDRALYQLRDKDDEIDHLRARLAAIDNAPTVAVISVDAMGVSCQMTFPNSQSRTKTTTVELIARPAKE